MPYPSNTQPVGVAQVIDSGRRKPVPRTLKQAFPQSEGYRFAIEGPAGEMLPLDGSIVRQRRRWLTADRVCWLMVLAGAGWLLLWAWNAPKVGS
jgi:hypothetical protein